MATQMTKSQLIEKIAEANELSKRDVKGVLESLATIGYKELKKNGTFLVPGFAKFVVIKKPATKGQSRAPTTRKASRVCTTKGASRPSRRGGAAVMTTPNRFFLAESSSIRFAVTAISKREGRKVTMAMSA